MGHRVPKLSTGTCELLHNRPDSSGSECRAEGLGHETCEAHTPVAHGRRADDRRIASDYRVRDLDCSLAPVVMPFSFNPAAMALP
jgi:hypothetical protein